MQFLVTGADGFIGTHLSNELKAHGHYVNGIDREFGDLRTPSTIEHALDKFEPDYVIHLAAKVGRLFGEDNAMFTVQDNAGITALVAKACGDAGVPVAYASTSEVYGDLGASPAWEGCKMKLPHNLYGLSKRWGEEVLSLYAPNGLINFRLSMPYGPGLPPGFGRAAIVCFLDQAERGEPIYVHKGSERSWCWVGDTVRGMRYVLEGQLDGNWNVGRDDNAVSMKRVAEIACDLTGASYDLIHEVDPPDRQTVVKRLVTRKLRDTGWRPEVSLEEGMKRTLEWLRVGMPSLNGAAVDRRVSPQFAHEFVADRDRGRREH